MSQGAAAKTDGAVSEVLGRIREMLYSMRLLPGQPIPQETLASELGVSRGPVREALRILQSEGLIIHGRNVGYSVKRITSSELEQAYSMRRLLETELLRNVARPSLDDIAYLRSANTAMSNAMLEGDSLAARKANRQFHFAMYEASGLHLMTDELERVWRLTEAYRSFYIADGSKREQIVSEHEAMIVAYEAFDVDRLIANANAHRNASGPTMAPIVRD